jgi:hypothetical protein
MATQVKYQLTKSGWPIGIDGQIDQGHLNIATFDTVEEAAAFIEENSEEGTYNIHTYIIKTAE